MIQKRYLKNKPLCKVTFSLEKKDVAHTPNSISVIGDFNDWNAKKGQLKKLKNGTFKNTFTFESNKEYEFKYLINDNQYINEKDSDSYRWNDYAMDQNSVLSLYL